MENNLNGEKKQVTKEIMSYETTDISLKTVESSRSYCLKMNYYSNITTKEGYG